MVGSGQPKSTSTRWIIVSPVRIKDARGRLDVGKQEKEGIRAPTSVVCGFNREGRVEVYLEIRIAGCRALVSSCGVKGWKDIGIGATVRLVDNDVGRHARQRAKKRRHDRLLQDASA